MDKDKLLEPDAESLAKRRVPCMVAFLHPFRIVNGPKSLPWNVTIDDINRTAWDYVALHELVGGVDVGMPPPYHMVFSRDGGVALPPLPQLRGDQEAVEFFNRCFAAMLLGGIYCEAIDLDGLDFGSILDWKYVRVHTGASAAANRFHQLVRLRQVSALEAILLSSPRTVSVADLQAATTLGRSVLDSVPELRGEFLLKGVTGFARRDWGAALANLWIVIEQITSMLWDRRMIRPARVPDPIPGRADQLSDPRTWTISVRHEVLYQIGTLSRDLLAKLALARKARNALAHNGTHPPEGAARAAYGSMCELLEVAVPACQIPLLKLDLDDHTLSDPFAPPKVSRLNPTHWMEIPKLPGEAEIERLEAKLRVNLAKTNRPEPSE